MTTYTLLQITPTASVAWKQFEAESDDEAHARHVEAWAARPFKYAMALEYPTGERFSFNDSKSLCEAQAKLAVARSFVRASLEVAV